MNLPGVIGTVVERKPSSSGSKPPILSPTAKAGFPSVQHRSLEKGKSKSAFARSREAAKTTPSIGRDEPVPRIISSHRPQSQSEEDWRAQISRENEEKVERMSGEERQNEIKEILERFGPDVGEILKRARAARQQKEKPGIPLQPIPVTSEVPEPTIASRSGSPPISSMSASNTRHNSPTRGSRKLRFAELVPENVHVYESAPPSPRKKSLLALPPPPTDPEQSSDIVSLGTVSGSVIPQQKSFEDVSTEGVGESLASPAEMDEDLEEGTPEYIRKRFFPSDSANNPDLAWIAPPPDGSGPATGNLRFDLTGTPIPPSVSLSLPTHLGLHHHAEGQSAGYTLEDIFMLSRSTVPAQRAAMLGVLRGIVVWWRRATKTTQNTDDEAIIQELASSPSLLKRILFAGLEALPERGVPGVRAIEIVWECIVGWDPVSTAMDHDEYYEWGGIEIGDSELIEAFPLADVLPRLSDVFSSPPDASASVDRLVTPVQHLIISILHRLALHSTKFADEIGEQTKLIPPIVRSVIDQHVSVTSNTQSDIRALRLLVTLSLSSRTNARTICDHADMFLRVIAILKPLPHDRDFPHLVDILCGIMRLYTILARYGMFSHVATDGRELWWKLFTYIESPPSDPSLMESHLKLVSVWARMLESWIICATDPHRTTPSHDLLWSQVVGWEWGKDLLAISEGLANLPVQHHACQYYWRTRASIFAALSAWLDGSKVNSAKGGHEERSTSLTYFKNTFAQDQLDGQRVSALVQEIKSAYSVTNVRPVRAVEHSACELISVIRLWLSCCPPTSEPLDSPPFDLPFSYLSEISALLVRRDDWHTTAADAFSHLRRRPLTSFLFFYLRLSRLLPGVSEDMWLAQAFSTLLTLQSGDEEYALDMIDSILKCLTPEWATSRELNVPQELWDKGGWDVARPFFRFEIQQSSKSSISPLCFSPRSLSQATRQWLPPIYSAPGTEWSPSGLPLRRDWTISPLDHMLHSGNSASLFSNADLLPSSFDTSETDIVRASLLLTIIAKEVIRRFANVLSNAVMTREEAVFSCMKMFMLEHEQDQNQKNPEVFRDSIVARYAEELLSDYTVSTVPQNHSSTTMEEVAVGFLGSKTPFYQYYTDFVALYDSISFSHSLFARLLLPPTSMRYPIDYRKHLWNDFSHLIRTILVPTEKMISADLREYLWPVEDDPQMIGAYIRALVDHGPQLQGFVRTIAIHHIACNIWPDSLHDREINEERASKLSKVVVNQCSPDVVREVMKYRQNANSFVAPPASFNDFGRYKAGRWEHLERWGGPSLVQKVEGLFNE